ncbi:MAG: nucleotidyltransferase domain-containing protein [bacterium]
MDKLEIVMERLKKYKPIKVILFGSYGTESADEYSDLDLVVIKKTKRRFIRRLIEVSNIIGSDIDKVDVFVYTPEEWEKMIEWENPFAQEVLKKGRIIYEKG